MGTGKSITFFYSVEGWLALREDKVKEQVAGLELQHIMFELYGNSVLRTQIPKFAIWSNKDCLFSQQQHI